MFPPSPEQEALNETPPALWLYNSAIVAVGTTVLSILLAILPAYALLRMRFRGMPLFGLALFVTQMLPEAIRVLPLYSIFGEIRCSTLCQGCSWPTLPSSRRS